MLSTENLFLGFRTFSRACVIGENQCSNTVLFIRIFSSPLSLPNISFLVLRKKCTKRFDCPPSGVKTFFRFPSLFRIDFLSLL